MTFFDPLSDPCWPASDTAGDRTSYLASYLAAQKPTKRQPDIYQAVFNYYLAVLETRLLMVHPSLGRVFLAREPSRAYLSRLLTMTPKERAVGVARARAVSMYLSCVQPDGKWIR